MLGTNKIVPNVVKLPNPVESLFVCYRPCCNMLIVHMTLSLKKVAGQQFATGKKKCYILKDRIGGKVC